MSNPLILGTNSIKDTGYEVANSLRFDRASSTKLERTPSSAGNRRTFTFSCWFKLGKLASSVSDYYQIFGGTTGGVNEGLFISDTDQLAIWLENSFRLVTNQKLRDPSAWYHVVMAVDTTNSTADNRLRLYLNGSEITSYATRNNPTQNYDSAVNNTSLQNIGERQNDDYFDGYMAEVVMIDGQQLDPTSFGEFDSDSPTIWKPIDVSGLTFGTNGFYLDFENSGSLGADVSGNGNNFTVNNLTSIDQSTDTCTNNYCTWNPLKKYNDSGTLRSPSYDNGNLRAIFDDSGYNELAWSTIGVTQGKWYCEMKAEDITATDNTRIGIVDLEITSTSNPANDVNTVFYMADGQKRIQTTSSAYGNSYTNGDIIGIALDLDNNAVYFSKNGTFQNSGDPTSGASKTGAISLNDGVLYSFTAEDYASSGNKEISANFGSPSFSITSGNSDANGYGNFEYSVPSGYYALNTKNLAEFG